MAASGRKLTGMGKRTGQIKGVLDIDELNSHLCVEGIQVDTRIRGETDAEAQWQNTCLVNMRPWVQWSVLLKKKIKIKKTLVRHLAQQTPIAITYLQIVLNCGLLRKKESKEL